ncbi:MAG: PD-(D/E)XK nuclease domain-containing protein [Bacteroidales bacterium]|nr:PD-(D/E)XK nuclease domain-containing protein [Bacteroidales bacterium]
MQNINHRKATSFLEFNDENSMACAIKLAYYSAISEYEIFREFPTGKGFADMVFLPITSSVFPAIVVGLKWDKSAKGTLAKIKNKEYPKKLQRFSREIVLLGINYDKDAPDIKYEVELEGVKREKVK